MHFTNQQIAELLRSVGTALTLKKANMFQVRAYETAADGIEHSTVDLKDLYEEGKLGDIPGVGASLAKHLEELFRTGKVSHFEELKSEFPEIVYELIKIPGVGPKTALELANLGVKSLENLGDELDSGKLIEKGFSEKINAKIKLGLEEYKGLGNRMLLPVASAAADKIIAYLKAGKDIKEADTLGSLRRKVVTIGDLDFAASTNDPEKALDYFIKMPSVREIISKGENKVMVVLNSGVHVDLLVGPPQTYGALLQHFTGSKHHNIHLRTLSEKKGYSLSEHGVKNLKTGEIVPIKQEKELYKMLGMDTPEPEMREDTGEIEAAIEHKLPNLIDLKDIKGDLHTHSNFPMEPSHGPGLNKIEEIIEKAEKLGYQYIGISDHSPGFTKNSKEKILKLVADRTNYLSSLKKSKKSIRVLNGLEIDILPDGTLSVPNEGLETLDYCIAGVHSSHKMPKEQMTKRILKALENPHLNILSHPTGRILNERQSYDANWDEIFKFCAQNNKVLEINAHPNRLDLRDDLIRQALKFEVKFIIDTDAHEISQMDNMIFGVDLSKRGWAEGKDIVNTWEWKKFAQWFNIVE